MKVTGKCHCGEIAFEAEVNLDEVGICHCTDCQVLSASAYRTITAVPSESYKITKGEPKEYVKVAESGNQRILAFCGNCGSALYSEDVGENPKVLSVRVGTMDQREQLEPKFEIWCQSALSWLPNNTQTKKYDKRR